MARTPTIIPQEVKEQMCRDYRRGTSVRQIASIYGIGRNKAYQIVQSGCEIKMGRPTTKDSLRCENMKQDYLNGLGIKKIAKKYGFRVETVYRYLKELGINVNEHRGKPKQYDIIKDLEIGELSQSEIARKNNVSRQYVLQVKKKMEEKKDEIVAL